MFQLAEWDKDTNKSDPIYNAIFKKQGSQKRKQLNSSIEYNKAKLQKGKIKSKRKLKKNIPLLLENEGGTQKFTKKNKQMVHTKETSIVKEKINKKHIEQSSKLNRKQDDPNIQSKVKKKKKKSITNTKVTQTMPDVSDSKTNNILKRLKSNKNERSQTVKAKKKKNKVNVEATQDIQQQTNLKKNKKVKHIKPSDNNEENSHSLNKKKKKMLNQFQSVSRKEVPESINVASSSFVLDQDQPIILDYREKKKNKLKQKIEEVFKSKNVGAKPKKKQSNKNLSLREKMLRKLKAARFRYLNEEIYSNDSKEAQKIFRADPEAFRAYHEGYRQQVEIWPLNPLDVIIESIQKLPQTHIVADFGCGEAKLAQSVEQKVHSFDLVAANNSVTACDMAHVPLRNNTVDVAVFCLSLMGTNLHDYLFEANRVLKIGGILKIAEVESRFDNINQFIQGLQHFKFKNTWTDLSHNLFYFLDFKKEANIKNKNKLPTISLHPCLYKKR